jgi:hypothetical protein
LNPLQTEFGKKGLENPIEHPVLIPAEGFQPEGNGYRFAYRLLDRSQVDLAED